MKKAYKLTIKQWINDKLVLDKTKMVCGYCESGNVYSKLKSKSIFCRACGKESILE